jgi:hypothetical protein
VTYRQIAVTKQRLMVAVGVLVLGLVLPGGGSAAEEPCTDGRVQTLASQFVDAFNAGDVGQLDQLFAPAGDFRWFVVDEYTHWDRTTLVRYFEQQRDDRVELRLTRFRFIGHSGGYGHFEFALVRTTRRGDLNYHGKGAALCRHDESDVLVVWAMGRESQPRTGRRELLRAVRSVHRQARRSSRFAQLG